MPQLTGLRHRFADAANVRYRARVALARVAWFECLIVAVELDDAAPAGDAAAGVDARPLEPGDLDALLRLRPEYTRAQLEARLAAGHLGMSVWLDGELVAASWMRFDCIWVPILERSIPLADGEAYSYDSYTHPAHRRRGIATARSQAAIAEVRQRGYRRIVGCILPGNPAALAAALAAGARPVRRVRWLHLGPFGVESVRDLGGAVRSRAAGLRRPEPEFPLS